MVEYADVPGQVLERLRAICRDLPEAYEEQAWTGRRWRIRNRTIAHVLTVDRAEGPVTVLTFRSAPPELDALRHAGHPFFRAGDGDTVGVVLDSVTDWAEIAELLADSYCLLAPKKLVTQFDGA